MVVPCQNPRSGRRRPSTRTASIRRMSHMSCAPEHTAFAIRAVQGADLRLSRWVPARTMSPARAATSASSLGAQRQPLHPLGPVLAVLGGRPPHRHDQELVPRRLAEQPAHHAGRTRHRGIPDLLLHQREVLGTLLVDTAVRHPYQVGVREARLEAGLHVETVVEQLDLHVLEGARLRGGEPVMGPGHEGVVEGTALPEGEDVRHAGPPPAPAPALSPESRLPQKPRPLSLPPFETAAVHHGAANPLDQHRAIVRPRSVAPVTLAAECDRASAPARVARWTTSLAVPAVGAEHTANGEGEVW